MIDNAQIWANEIGKYLSGNCTDAEIDALMRWKNANSENKTFFEEMESVWQITQPSEQYLGIDLDTQWKKIANGIAPVRTSVAKRRVMYQMVAAVAAIALFVVAVSLNWNQTDTENRPMMVSAVQPDENELVILPDNSKVWLRSGSEITYDADFSPRNVTLKGEAFFEVTSDPDHPFVVRTKEASVKVLGTRFNLKETSGGDVELYVEEGRVSFGQEDAPAAKVLVTRDQVAVFKINTLEVERIELEDVNRLSWKTGKLIFDDAILRDVLRDLERHYQISFEVADPAMLECGLKADFEQSSLQEVIETIEFTMGWAIEKEQEMFLITGNPCKNTEK